MRVIIFYLLLTSLIIGCSLEKIPSGIEQAKDMVRERDDFKTILYAEKVGETECRSKEWCFRATISIKYIDKKGKIKIAEFIDSIPKAYWDEAKDPRTKPQLIQITQAKFKCP